MPTLLSVTSSEFLDRARAAIGARGEVLALHRPAYAGGAKDWVFLRSSADLKRFLGRGRRRSAFSVFLGVELDTRGRADAPFVTEALDLLGRCGEILLVELYDAGDILADCGTDDPCDAGEWLRGRGGRPVAAGGYPPFWAEEGDVVLAAYVPDTDGVVRPGAY